MGRRKEGRQAMRDKAVIFLTDRATRERIRRAAFEAGTSVSKWVYQVVKWTLEARRRAEK